ncbi:outer membrane beta-barrel protein [Fusobacteria bacterium ZRK30]|nr:outer membrane beta-barrel protein [Fusobacteria bacterium ZRK30]
MKKKLLLMSLMTALSTGAMAISGSWGMSMEGENNSNAFNNGDMILPAITGTLFPMEDSSFYVGTKITTRIHLNNSAFYNADDRSLSKGDGRDRYEIFTGYTWTEGNFSFMPKIAYRYENYKFKQSKDQMHFVRINPNMKYTVNEDVTVYFKGLINPGTKKGDAYDWTNLDGTKTGHKDSYKHKSFSYEAELGAKYKLADNQDVAFGVYNEREIEKDKFERNIWEARAYYDYKFENGVKAGPYARFCLSRNDKGNGDNKFDKYSNKRNRYGIKADFPVSETFAMYSEVYYQVHKNAGIKKGNSVTNDRLFYKLGFTQKF